MILRPDDPHQMYFVSRSELVADEPLVSMVEYAVDGLDLEVLYDRYSESGRSFYDPSMLLKIWFFSYSDGVRSSREVAKRIKYDVRYQYFSGSLRPDFRTINRFRSENLDLLGDYFAQIVTVCEASGLVDVSVLAVDGTKIRASSSSHRTVSKKKRDELSKQFHAVLEHDSALEGEGSCDISAEEGNATDASFDEPITECTEEAISTVKITDPDARFMKTSEGSLRPGYNTQIAVDKNQVIVAADVSTIADDSVQFEGMIDQSRDNVRGSLGEVLVDGGYYSGRNLKHAASAGYDLYMPIPEQSRSSDKHFEREAFVYDEARDCYRCPAGKELSYAASRIRNNGVTRRVYRGSSSICGQCQLRSRCTKKRYRELNISEVYDLEREMQSKMSTPSGRATYGQRKHLVEAVFGNLKFNLGFTHFKLRSLPKVRGEFLLMCIAHNLKKLARYNRSLHPGTIVALKAVQKVLLRLLRLCQRLHKTLPLDFRHVHTNWQLTGEMC